MTPILPLFKDSFSFIRKPCWAKANNFPSVGVFDLDLRPSDDKLFAFTYGMGAWVMEIKSLQHITFEPLSTKEYGNLPFALIATATSGLPITYSSSNPAVATISDNQVTITGVGTTTLTANQTGNHNFAPAADVSQELTVLPSGQWILFPNPVNDVLTIKAKGLQQPIDIHVYNTQGKKVIQLSQHLVQGQLKIMLKHLPPGKYLFKIRVNGQTIVRQIIKQ